MSVTDCAAAASASFASLAACVAAFSASIAALAASFSTMTAKVFSAVFVATSAIVSIETPACAAFCVTEFKLFFVSVDRFFAASNFLLILPLSEYTLFHSANALPLFC